MNEKVTKTEDLWTPFKDLYRTINYYLKESSNDYNTLEFENVLRKYKQSFFSLLQNPPKSAKSREELKKGLEDGITIKEVGHQILSKDLYQETIILSDMYDLNEFVALDLLCTAQMQMPYHSGLPRGLVAVLLYYEGRKAVVSSLQVLVQARRGNCWSMNLTDSLVDFITQYTNQLMENGLFNRIFELLKTLDLNKEIEKLQDNVALGGPKHRRQVTDLFNDIRRILAETVFLWSAQCGLPKEPTLALIGFLRLLKIEEDATGDIDDVSFFLSLAFLSAVDLSIIHNEEDGDKLVQRLPLLTEKNFFEALCAELSPSKPHWVSKGLQAIASFGFAVTLATLKLVPQSPQLQLVIDKEVTFLCAAIDLKVFEFLNYKFLTCKTLYTDQIYYRRIHYLITDFIIHMFSKVKELRIKADETARVIQVYRQEGLEPPTNLPKHFEYFIEGIIKFYSEDALGLHLSLEFWCPLQEMNSHKSTSRSMTLFKFIKLAGDMVPSTLFVPFLNMLSSLSNNSQAARYCFNLLKQSGSAFNNTVSWDHFFMSFSQYYNNLRSEVAPVTDTVYTRRGLQSKGITSQEIEGLQAVLKLIRTIAENDDFSRLALCEHPGWSPLTIFLGLIGCCISTHLKAELLLTLAALSKSPETAVQMWNNLEGSQILVTVPTTSNYQPRGIQTELDEIESRAETYPLTRAILKLLDVLTDFGIPRTLGAGPRKPGFDPYLTFIISSIFLKFNTRCYRNGEERWIVGSMCLKLLEKFLSQYEPQTSDFPNGNKVNEFNSPPGYHIMTLMNSKSEFLNLVFFIIEEGLKHFQNYASFLGQKYVEQCTLQCLNLLEHALSLQNIFFNLSASLPSPTLLTQLSKLLLIINPRSGQPDYGLIISKYLCHQYLLPRHPLVAVKILTHLTSSPGLHSQFFNILLSNDKESRFIRSGFVECLDGTNAKSDSSSDIKEYILKLLKQCLMYSTPNLSHFLLGFDIKHDISQTLFQQPGVLDFPRNCLHSVFTILKCAIVKGTNIANPTLVESSYNMLYLLCINHKTSSPVLRFIKQNPRFFQDHLISCLENASKESNDNMIHLNQLSWLLKTIAIEMKVMANSNQTLYLQQLSRLLVGMPMQEKNVLNDTLNLFLQANSTRIDESITIANFDPNKFDNILIKLLAKFELTVEEVILPKWNYFDNNALCHLLSNCQTNTTPKMIDIKKLHHILIDEMSTIHANSSISQRQAIMQEIEKVLVYALSLNNNNNHATALIRFIDAWRQVVEVLSIYFPYEVLSVAEKQMIAISLLEAICRKVSKTLVLPEIGNFLSGTILILMETLTKCYLKIDQDISQALQSNLVSLKTILNYLIEWIVTSNANSQDVRINLYTALVTFLQLLNRNKSIKNADIDGNLYVNRLDSSRIHILSQQNILDIPTFSERFIELICYDCIGGNDATKALAMSTFSLLISITGNTNWIIYMESRGYLKNIIESILNSDESLQLALEPLPTNLKPLYLHMSKIYLLSQIAMLRMGAELLLEQRILPCLSSMKVFSLHPEILKQTQVPPKGLEDFFPTVGTRYLKMFLPTLHLCHTIITSLSAENLSAIEQILYYLISHLDVVDFVLRSGNPFLSTEFLDELECLTSLIARTTSIDLVLMFQGSNTGIQDNKAHLYRIQKLMLHLLPRFLLNGDVLNELLNDTSQSELPSYQTSDRLILTFKIISNLMMYSRSLIANNNLEHRTACVIFQPSLGDLFSSSFNHGNSGKHSEQLPTLGVILQHLIYMVNHYHEEKGTLDFLTRKVNEIPNMNNADFKELLGWQQLGHDINVMREQGLQYLGNKLNQKKQEIEHCNFIIEIALYILWAHLDYYMLRAIPKARHGNLPDLSTNLNLDVTLASSYEATWKVYADDISNLKQGLVSVFNDSFSRQLMETAMRGSDVKKQFIENLLRKIKRLIQFVPVK